MCLCECLIKFYHGNLLMYAQTYTNVEDVVVGGISIAYSGNKPMQNASTATEVVTITPSASQFEYRVRVICVYLTAISSSLMICFFSLALER